MIMRLCAMGWDDEDSADSLDVATIFWAFGDQWPSVT